MLLLSDLDAAMAEHEVHRCSCAACGGRKPHAQRLLHKQINVLANRLDEQQRRWFVAPQATQAGRGNQVLRSQITGVERHTIERGQRELAAGLADRPVSRVRLPGGGRPAQEVNDAGLLPALQALLEPETDGEPIGEGLPGERSSLARLSQQLAAAGHLASRPTVSQLLRVLGYSPKLNSRRLEARSAPPADSAERVRRYRELTHGQGLGADAAFNRESTHAHRGSIG